MVCSKVLFLLALLFHANFCESQTQVKDSNSNERAVHNTVKNVGSSRMNTNAGKNTEEKTSNARRNIGIIDNTNINVETNTKRTTMNVGQNTAHTHKTNTIGATITKGTAKVGPRTAYTDKTKIIGGTNTKRTTTAGWNTVYTSKANTIGRTITKRPMAMIRMKNIGTKTEKTTAVDGMANGEKISPANARASTGSTKPTVVPSPEKKVLANAHDLVQVIRTKTGQRKI